MADLKAWSHGMRKANFYDLRCKPEAGALISRFKHIVEYAIVN